MSERDNLSRRAVTHILGAALLTGFAGCTGDSQNNELSGPVPKAYRTATTQSGERRNPDSLTSKEGARYQSESSGESNCANCKYYISDKNGDNLGACSLVRGYIEPNAWCNIYAEYQGKTG